MKKRKNSKTELKGKKIFITGGAGFIASHLLEKLLPHNNVIIYDKFHRNALAQTSFGKHPHLKVIRGDVLNRAHLRRHLRDMDMVIHMASIAGVDEVMKNPVKTMEINLLGTYNTCQAARDQCPKLSRFVDFSTSEVFGTYAYKVSEGDVTSLGSVGETRWTYAVSKIAMEHFLFNLHRQEGFPATSVRPFNIYGPRQAGEGAIKRFIINAITNQDIIIHNDGSPIRAWCYVDDIIDGVMRVLCSPKAVGHAFNFGNPAAALTILQLAKLVRRIADSKSKVKFVKWQNTEIELRVPNIDKGKKLLGWTPKIDLETGLLRTIEAYRTKGV